MPNPDPLPPVDEVPPPAMPAPPAYDTTEGFEPTPAYDALAAEAPLTDPLGSDTTTGTGAGSTSLGETALPAAEPTSLSPDADYALAPGPTDAGPLAQVKALATDRPAVFLGAALAAGWLVGKLTSRGDKSDTDD